SPADGHWRLLPHEQQHLGAPGTRSNGGMRQSGIERRSYRVGLARMSGEQAEQTGDPGDITERVGVDPEMGDAKLPESPGHGSVLARVVEHDEVGPLRQHRLDA